MKDCGDCRENILLYLHKSLCVSQVINFVLIWKYVEPVGKWSRRKRNYLTSYIDRGLFIPPRLPSEIAFCEQLKG
jgi:hypothetical protein